MTNKYLAQIAPEVAGTTIRSAKHNADIQAIDTAFEKVDADMRLTLQLPETFTGNNRLPDLTTTDTLLYINEDNQFSFYPLSTLNNNFALSATNAQTAQSSAASASSSASQAQASASSALSSANNALSSMTRAETARDEAEAIVGGDFATNVRLDQVRDESIALALVF